MELNTLVRVLCTREYDSQCSKDFVRLLSIINVYLLEKNNNLVHCTHTKSSRDLVKKFEKDHKPLNGYFEKKIIKKFERVV